MNLSEQTLRVQEQWEKMREGEASECVITACHVSIHKPEWVINACYNTMRTEKAISQSGPPLPCICICPTSSHWTTMEGIGVKQLSSRGRKTWKGKSKVKGGGSPSLHINSKNKNKNP